MIRRTLINRAQRQRELARTLIARHSMISAHQPSRPQLNYRPAAARDDQWELAAAIEAAAPALEQIAPSVDELANLFIAWRESQPTDAPPLFDPAQPAAPTPSAITEPDPVYSMPDVPEPASAPAHSTATMSLAPESASAHASAATAPDQSAGNTLADLVRRMRAPDWVSPEASLPATTPPALASATPTASEQIANTVRQMQRPSQPAASRIERPQIERPRIPLGQRMSEAADFGQTPASPHDGRPIAIRLPAEPAQPARTLAAEAADIQPAQVFAETVQLAAESNAPAGDSPVALPTLLAPGTEQWPMVEHSNGEPEITISTPTAISAAMPRIVPLVGSPDVEQTTAIRPLIVSGASREQPANASAPEKIALPARIRDAVQATGAPSSVAVDRSREQPANETSTDVQVEDRSDTSQVPFQSPTQKAADATIIPAASKASDPRAPAADSQRPNLSPALPWHAAPIAIGEEQVNVSMPVPTAAGLDIRASEPMLTQLVEPSPVPATPTITALTVDRATPALVAEPSTRPSPEINRPPEVVRDMPRQLAERAPAAMTSAHPNRPVQPHIEPTQLVESESRPILAEVDTLSMPVQALAKSQPAPAETDSLDIPAQTLDMPTFDPAESQAVSIRQPESSLPQVQHPSLLAQSAQPVELPSAFASSAKVEPAADSQSSSAAAALNIARPSLPQAAAEYALIAPERAEPPKFTPIVEPAQAANMPTIAQQPAPESSNRVEGQLDIRLSTQRGSLQLAATESARMAPDYIPASDQHVTDTALAEPAPTQSQALHMLEPQAAPAIIEPARASKRTLTLEANETPLARSNDLEPALNATSAAKQPRLNAARQITTQPAPIASSPSTISQRSDLEPPSSAAASDIAAAPKPGLPQPWAARLVTHRQATEPQPEPIDQHTPVALYVDRSQGTPSAPQVIQPAPDQIAVAVTHLTRSSTARFVPARRDQSRDAFFAQSNIRPPATPQSPVVANVSAAVDGTPAAAAPADGTPQAWAARLISQRQATESQPEPTIERTPAASITPLPQPQPTVERRLAPPVDVPHPLLPAAGSPQAWAARLFPQAQLAAPQQLPSSAAQQVKSPIEQQNMPAIAPTAAQAQPPAQPHHAPDAQPQVALQRADPMLTAETTRRFLQPLVGIDPTEVRVFRGPVASQATAAYQADALASGDTIALAAEHSEDSPATLGVLAHELTHIARQRDARFVPPIMRQEGISGAADEESLAQSVEAQVRRIAHGRAEVTWRSAAPSAAIAHSSMPIVAPPQPRPPEHDAPIATMAHAAPDPQPSAHGPEWGGLPAPWESLPEWLDAPKQAEIPTPAAPPPTRPTQPAPPTATSVVSTSVPPVQLASTGRMLDALPAQSASVDRPAQQPAPDLDALARQVYAVLKQRLAAERRRSQS